MYDIDLFHLEMETAIAFTAQLDPLHCGVAVDLWRRNIPLPNRTLERYIV